MFFQPVADGVMGKPVWKQYNSFFFFNYRPYVVNNIVYTTILDGQ